MRRIFLRTVSSRGLYVLLFALHCSALARAADRAPLTQGQDVITTPGIGRVVFVFLITSAIAIGAIVALRRYLPQFGTAAIGGGQIRVIERTTLIGGTRVHLIEIGEQRLVVADSRNGIAITILDKHTKAAHDVSG